MSENESMQGGEEAASAPVVKRRPGRPRKNPKPAAAEEAAGAQQNTAGKPAESEKPAEAAGNTAEPATDAVKKTTKKTAKAAPKASAAKQKAAAKPARGKAASSSTAKPKAAKGTASRTRSSAAAKAHAEEADAVSVASGASEASASAAAASDAAAKEPVRTRRSRQTAQVKRQQESGEQAEQQEPARQAEPNMRQEQVELGEPASAAQQAEVESRASRAEGAAHEPSEPEPSEPERADRAEGARQASDQADRPAKAPVSEGEAESARRPRRQVKAGRPADAASQRGAGSQHQGGKGSKQPQRQQLQKRGKRDRQGRGREVAPSVTLEDLAACKVAELRARASDLELDVTGLKKAELVQAVYAATMKAEGFIEVSGVLDILADGYGFLRTQGYLPSESDCYVGLSLIRRCGLRKGDLITGQTRPARENEKYAAIQKVLTINGRPLEECANRVRFADLTPVYPDERLWLEHGKNSITARVIDFASPIGKGQRGLIVSPPKAGKTTILKDIAASISANNPEVHLMCLLVDERPEEVTDMQRSIKGEVISSTFDMPSENHIAVSELVVERAKRMVEEGRDVVILLDSLTRLARAYNLAQPASGRILSGGVDSTALYPPKRFLGAARNIENGGSLTILASALVDTGSKMDEVIFEEFKGTGNMELRLDRNLADRRIFPAIDPVSSGTRKEDLLLDPQEAPLIWAVRRILANMNNTERAMDMLIKSLKQTETNQEFLIRTAKKAQHSKSENIVEF